MFHLRNRTENPESAGYGSVSGRSRFGSRGPVPLHLIGCLWQRCAFVRPYPAADRACRDGNPARTYIQVKEK
ncbi:hypothetical protein CH275_22465 [Rhodococcus sp. 06-235-1A]|nr:hypothetical protein CH275_22465 [Rhodococcus sp. 06-235-1A]